MNLDEIIFTALASITHQSNLLDGLIIIFAEYIGYVIPIVWFIVCITRKGWKERMYVFAVSTLSVIMSWGIITEGIKHLYERPRPFVALGIETLMKFGGYESFPSSHMAFFGVLALSVYTLNKKLGTWVIIGIIGMGLARIMGGVHWPSDIIAGAGSAFLSFYSIKLLLAHKGYTQSVRTS